MPANATGQRVPIAVSIADSPRRAQNSPVQGAAFRSALDSIEHGANSDSKNGYQKRGPGRDESLQEAQSDERGAQRGTRRDAAAEVRREDRANARRADAKEARREADSTARRDEESTARREEMRRSSRSDESRDDNSSARPRENKDQHQVGAARHGAASTNTDHELQESSGGGFGSDPPVLEFPKAGGSDRATQTLATAPGAAANQESGVVADSRTAARSGKETANTALQSAVFGAAEQLSSPAAKTGGTPGSAASTSQAQSEAASAGALAVSAALDGEAMGDEPPVLSVDPASEDIAPMAAKLERAIIKAGPEPMVRASSGGESSTSQVQASGGQSVEPGPRGLAGSANRAGLDGSQQPGPTADPFNEPEPLPGSVRLRGLRGARINVPTGDGEVISARLNVNEEQVDIRLSVPEGSSQLAEQRASELKQALSSHGMELGEFDVSTSDGQRSETSSGDESGESSAGEANSQKSGTAVDPWGRPVDAETQRGSAADGRGALLDLRL